MVALVVAMIGVLLAGCGSAAGGGDGTSYVAGDGAIVVVPPARRQPITLRGATLEGAPFDLASLRGRPVVVNVWGSWCPPCRKEAPELQAASVTLRPKAVSFIGIDVREGNPAQAKAFQETFGVTYPSLSDDGGTTLLGLRGAIPPNAIPSTLVIDAQGRVAARISGATTRITLVDLVDDVIAGRDRK